MDHHDRQAIEGLFDKLGRAAEAQPRRDAEADALIAGLMARHPGAAYYLAQTVIMQEQALNAAEAQMQRDRAEPQAQGGLLGRLFGGGTGRPASQGMAPARQGMAPASQGRGAMSDGQAAGPWNSGRPAGGGFMAGAAQTAMGVAGGVLLGNAIGGMFAGPAEASEMMHEPLPEDEAGFDDPGMDDGGMDDGDFGE